MNELDNIIQMFSLFGGDNTTLEATPVSKKKANPPRRKNAENGANAKFCTDLVHVKTDQQIREVVSSW